MEAYLDNSATTQAFPEVATLVASLMTGDYGNPSSMHQKGVTAESHVREAKEKLAAILKCKKEEILFTSGGTESDNLAIIGGAMAQKRRGMHLITTKIEHPAVLRCMQYLEKQGFEITYLGTDKNGVVSAESVEAALREDTILVSVMLVNNEIGTIQPVAEIGAMLKRHNPEILFHVDAVQGFGKLPIYPSRMNIDLMSVSGHKIHGPKGTGFLYIRDKVRIIPQLLGGGQQGGMRSGTENVPGIAGLSLASEMCYRNLSEDTARLRSLRERFMEGLLSIGEVSVNGGEGETAAPHIVSASVRGVRSEVLLHALEDKGVYVSAGSACSSHKREASATLTAIGLPKELLESTIRFSFSIFTTDEEIDYTLECMRELIPMLRRYSRK